ncbi:delta-60 repeat domain-containing protein [Planomonospora corallina]|uniref:Delta-60 repeat domain-containing protein n=1 Tax=Planomonospora corallina TaxID=1806052 RepID=A0ABV8I3A2_9ACTN
MFARSLPSSALAAALALTAVAVTGGAAAAGTVEHRRIVSADPVDTTPHVLDGIVNAIALVGGTVVVGGSFGEVRDAGSARVLERANIFAYDLATGRILPDFAPELDGPVNALAAGAGGTVYAGGAFAETGGAQARRLVRLRISDGAPVPDFRAQAHGGTVTSLVRHGSHLYVGGDFTHVGSVRRTALARLDAATGAVDPAFSVTPGAPRGSRVKVYAMALAAGRLAVDGGFDTLDGLSRPQLGLIDVASSPARVADWRTDAYAPKCKPDFPSYVRGLDFAPDGSYFVVVTSGGAGGADKLCDSAARFEARVRGETDPTWVNHTGGDTLYAVAVTGAAVYVGGHQRWLDNPHGRDSAGPGAVSRPGISAIHPVTGRALRWNPTRDRGIGVKAFLAHRGGLLVGSDTTRLGREYHARIGMFPLP